MINWKLEILNRWYFTCGIFVPLILLTISPLAIMRLLYTNKEESIIDTIKLWFNFIVLSNKYYWNKGGLM